MLVFLGTWGFGQQTDDSIPNTEITVEFLEEKREKIQLKLDYWLSIEEPTDDELIWIEEAQAKIERIDTVIAEIQEDDQ